MTKKGYSIAIVPIALLMFLILLSTNAEAQVCCVGPTGCSFELTAERCDPTSTSIPNQNCQNIPACDLYACCAPGLPPGAKVKTFLGCSNLTFAAVSFPMHFIGPWGPSTQPFVGIAETKCAAGSPPSCAFTSCDSVNLLTGAQECWCGNVKATAANQWCCARDSMAFATQAECRLSPQCQLPSPFSISGTITDTVNKAIIPGALITSGSKTVFSGADGTYTIEGLKSGEGVVIAIAPTFKTGSRTFSISNSDLIGIDIQLEPLVPPQREICDSGEDDDGDGAIDMCDKDCNPLLARSVLEIHRIPGVHINIVNGDEVEIDCTDGIDNDCDGLIDCFDPDCASHPACQVIFCGDGICQEPMEDCRTCPIDCGFCPAVCGNEILEGDEECEGKFDPATGAWMPTMPIPPAIPNINILQCGSPRSAFPCRWESVCGDGIAQGNEECDIGQDWLPGTGDDDDSLCPGLCGYDCRCTSFQVCGDGIRQGSEECDRDDNFNCGGLACKSDCTCEPSCAKDPDPSIIITPIGTARGAPKFTIEWKNEKCIDYANKFYVHSCKAAEGQEQCDVFTLSAELGKDARKYDFYFEPETNARYCFSVETLFESNVRISKNSSIECINTGDLECYLNKDEFCNRGFQIEERFGCNAANEMGIIEDCLSQNGEPAPEYICMGPYADGKTRCAFQSDCEQCNGLFGMFSGDAKALVYAPLPGYTQLIEQMLSCSAIQACYIDYSDTAVDKYYDCSGVSSCYDYRSKETCEDDPCMANKGECEFAEHFLYEETGFGVCRPKDSEEQYRIGGCGFCENPKNNVFGACTPETCSLYGDCYLAGTGRCIHKKDVTCWHFNSWAFFGSPDENNCNSTAQWRNEQLLQQNRSPANAEVGVNSMDNSRGMNKIFTRSDDYFDFGVCKFGAGHFFDGENPKLSCTKDANNDGVEDCPISGRLNQEILDCMLDMIPPNTTIVHQDEVGKYFELPVITERNSDTYACVVKRGDPPCYPPESGKASKHTEHIYENLILGTDTPVFNREGSIVGAVSELTEDGRYVLYYFSRDRSNNLEVVKSIEIYIDANAPDITVEWITEPTEFMDTYITDLTITMSAVDPATGREEAVECSAKLEVIYGNERKEIYPGLGIRKEYKSRFERTYPSLPDGIYYWTYVCRDSAGNRNEDEIMIKVEEDVSITNPSPIGIFNHANLTLSVDTQFPAVCRFGKSYGITIPGFDSMRADNSNYLFTQHDTERGGATHHTFPIAGLGNELKENEFYRFYAACNITRPDGTSKITQRNPADVITFSIDTRGPNLIFAPDPEGFASILTGTDIWYNDGTVDQNGVNITIICEDEPIIDRATGADWSFGCSELYYCRSGSEGCQLPSVPSYASDEERRFVFNDFTSSTLSYINSYVIDKGGNQGQALFNEKMLYDDQSPVFDVRIYNDEGEEVDAITAKSYSVVITSSEPLQQDSLALQLTAGDCTAFVDSFESTDAVRWTGTLMISNRLPCAPGKEQEASLSVYGKDVHNRGGVEITSGSKTVFLDTTPPRKLTFTPALADYYDIGYPMHYFPDEDVFYTGDCKLFVTGETDKEDLREYPMDIIVFQSKPASRTDVLFTQSTEPNDPVFETTGPQFVENSGDRVYFDGDLVGPISRDLFLGFQSHVNMEYGSYGKYYDIMDVSYQPNELLLHYLETELIISPSIERRLPNQRAFFYRRDVPQTWFGISLGLKPYDVSQVYFKVADKLGNELRNPQREFLNIFCDPEGPLFENATPLLVGTTNREDTELAAVVKKRADGSGIFKIEFRTGIVGNPSIGEGYECGAFTCYDAVFTPLEKLNGTVNVVLYAEDKAANKAELVWDFKIDTGAAAPPKVEFDRQNKFYDQRHFLNGIPFSFIVDFSDEEEQVLLENIMLGVGAVSMGRGIGCSRRPASNIFDCIFEGDGIEALREVNVTGGAAAQLRNHNLRIIASKNLTTGPANRGDYYAYFTIDTTPPNIASIDIEKIPPARVKPDVDIIFEMEVPNEYYDLEVELTTKKGQQVITSVKTIASRPGRSSTYAVKWRTPDAVEGDYDLEVIVRDMAGNEAPLESFGVFIDNTPPRADLITVTINPVETIKRDPDDGNNYRTKVENVAYIEGRIPDLDIVDVYAVRGSIISPKLYMMRTEATSFSLNVPLEGADGDEVDNRIVLTVVDEAGWVEETVIIITKDLKPPRVTESEILGR